MMKLLNSIGRLLLNFPHELTLNRSKIVVIKGFLSMINCKPRKLNWGDDINYYLLKELTGKEIIEYSSSILSRIFCKHYFLCIGSIVEMFCTKKCIIWGSGAMSETREIKEPPYEIFAVRGPLTRKRFLDINLGCPEVYGDPALLTSLVLPPPYTLTLHYKKRNANAARA